MAISASDFDKPVVQGSRKTRRVKFDITSYTNGGESVTAGDVGLKTLDQLVLLGNASDNGHIWEWDQANKQIKAFEPVGSHSHTAFTVNASETASDQTNFVSITEGDGTAQSGIVIGNAGGGTNEDIVSSSTSGAGSEAANATDVGAMWVMAYGR